MINQWNVLLVDDDEDDYVLTRAILDEVEHSRFGVEWVNAYEPALKALTDGRYDVCLLDYRLGRRNGLDLLREAAATGCRTPIILLTGQGDREVDLEAMKVGAADYLVKGQIAPCLLERSIRFAIERQRTLEALQRSEERYALAVRGANDGLWDWDLTAGLACFTSRWKAMLGYEEGEIGDSPEEWLSRVHPEDVDRVKADITAHRLGHTTYLQIEHRMLHGDGVYRWVLARGLAVRDAQGNPVRMAGSQTDITLRKAAEDRLLHDAFHDPLTGLPNRALFLDRLSRALLRGKRRERYRYAVLFIDLDGFKAVNDSLGHQAGDRLLIALSRRLEICARRGDTVARLAGDEFVILMDDFADDRDVFRLADRALEQLRTPFVIDDNEVVTTASIGIALGGPNYDRAQDLLRDADLAMYRAKAQGSASRVLFDPAMHVAAVTRMKLEVDLRQAELRKEYRLHFQPIVALRTGCITGFEALVRWEHPEHGLIPPDEFIPVAEQTGLILPLGLWVLREAATQIRQWNSEFGTGRPLSINVNLSGRQFFQNDLVSEIERILAETGLNAHELTIEVTESVIMNLVEMAPVMLAGLKELGVRLAMDDFGKGYSSLSYLHQFPFDTLKVDRSFVARIGAGGGNSEIVRTIVALAHGLGMDLVAEGVETADQLALLRELRCQFGQGYFFSRPLTAQAARALLASQPRWFDPEVRPIDWNLGHPSTPVTRSSSHIEINV
ncbi:MAG: hypothetical protein NVSMB9_00160 [Isosphaeraceae bacterium]